jgi:hypothetical protein
VENQPLQENKRIGWLTIGLIIVCVALLTSGLTIWMAKTVLFPTNFTPVQLNAQEEMVLDSKLRALSAPHKGRRDTMGRQQGAGPPTGKTADTLDPERYTEDGAKREIRFTERELNGLLAKNTQLADKLAIDLSDDLASAKLLLPLDPQFPVLGGKTLKVTAGLELRYSGTTPVVILRGVSIWGVPLPNAWMGGLKNIDLVKEFGAESAFWRTFSAGVETIGIEDGRLTLKLKP